MRARSTLAFVRRSDRASGVSCDANGVSVGDVALVVRMRVGCAATTWTVRPAAELEDELSALYLLPMTIAAKAGALALIATALNRGDLVMAASNCANAISRSAVTRKRCTFGR